MTGQQFFRNWIHAAVAAVMVAALPAVASADSSAQCEVLEIKATKEEGGVDPALKGLSKKLSQPPFDSFTSFKLLAKHKKTAERMKALVISLKTGGKLSLLFRDQVEETGKKPRLRITFNLDDKTGKRILDLTLKLDSGDTYLIAGGQLDAKSAHIMATSCTVK